MKLLLRTLAALALAAVTTTARAQAQAPQDPTAHRHLGFALRLDGGVGYMNSSGGGLTVKGGGGEFSVLVGGAVAEDFIVGGQLWGFSVSSPTLEQGGLSVDAGSDTSNTLVGIGPNITYYVMPLNLYLSATPAITKLSLKRNGNTGNTDAGFGMQLAVGKEWWVGDHWGLGLAGQFMFSTNPDSGTNVTSTAGGLVFSATYN